MTAIIFGVIFALALFTISSDLKSIANKISSNGAFTVGSIASQLTLQFQKQYGDKVKGIRIDYFADKEIGITILKTERESFSTAVKIFPLTGNYVAGTFSDEQARDANLPAERVNFLIHLP